MISSVADNEDETAFLATWNEPGDAIPFSSDAQLENGRAVECLGAGWKRPFHPQARPSLGWRGLYKFFKRFSKISKLLKTFVHKFFTRFSKVFHKNFKSSRTFEKRVKILKLVKNVWKTCDFFCFFSGGYETSLSHPAWSGVPILIFPLSIRNSVLGIYRLLAL